MRAAWSASTLRQSEDDHTFLKLGELPEALISKGNHKKQAQKLVRPTALGLVWTSCSSI